MARGNIPRNEQGQQAEIVLTEKEIRLLVNFRRLDQDLQESVFSTCHYLLLGQQKIARMVQNGERLEGLELRVASRRVGLRVVK